MIDRTVSSTSPTTATTLTPTTQQQTRRQEERPWLRLQLQLRLRQTKKKEKTTTSRRRRRRRTSHRHLHHHLPLSFDDDDGRNEKKGCARGLSDAVAAAAAAVAAKVLLIATSATLAVMLLIATLLLAQRPSLSSSSSSSSPPSMLPSTSTSSSYSFVYVYSLTVSTTTRSRSTTPPSLLLPLSSPPLSSSSPFVITDVTTTNGGKTHTGGPLFLASSSSSSSSSTTQQQQKQQQQEQNEDQDDDNDLVCLSTVTATQVAVLDGPEWTSVQTVFLKQQKQKQKQQQQHKQKEEEDDKNIKKTSSSAAAVAAGKGAGRKQQQHATKLGVIEVVAGYCVVPPDDNDNDKNKKEQQRRVVGILSSSSTSTSSKSATKMMMMIDKTSVATIPDNVSDSDAISTYLASISSIYCAAASTVSTTTSTTASQEGKGKGDDEDGKNNGRVAVVLGSSDLAQFSADGLSSLGYTTWIVSKDGKTFSNLQKKKNVKCISPSMDVVITTDNNDKNNDGYDDDEGRQQQGFAAHIGQFDALVDTIGNEQSTMLLSLDVEDGDGRSDDDDDNFFPMAAETSFGGSVLQLLKTRHSCSKYVSTVTHSQTLVVKDGIFSGPRQVDKYCQDVSKRLPIQQIKNHYSVAFDGQRSNDSGKKNTEWQHVSSLDGIGEVVTKLLASGVIYEDKKRRKICNDKAYGGNTIRGWSLSDFWEQTSWPRDSSGTSNTRYGLPVREDPYEETDARFLVSESPFRRENFQRVDMSEEEELSNGGYPVGVGGGSTATTAGDTTSRGGGRGVQDNPYVLNIVGVAGVESEIIEQEKDCIMFLSAKFCKTCKTINPVYTRMARLNQENSDDDDDDETNEICFIKAEASGVLGKELGRYLSVDAVPAFVLYRKGKRFGIPLSESKLPSRKIDRAISLLKSGEDWDLQYVTGEDTKKD